VEEDEPGGLVPADVAGAVALTPLPADSPAASEAIVDSVLEDDPEEASETPAEAWAGGRTPLGNPAAALEGWRTST